MQLSEQLKTVDEFEDLKETIVRMRSETNFLLEIFRKEMIATPVPGIQASWVREKMCPLCLFMDEVDKIHRAFH